MRTALAAYLARMSLFSFKYTAELEEGMSIRAAKRWSPATLFRLPKILARGLDHVPSDIE